MWIYSSGGKKTVYEAAARVVDPWNGNYSVNAHFPAAGKFIMDVVLDSVACTNFLGPDRYIGILAMKASVAASSSRSRSRSSSQVQCAPSAVDLRYGVLRKWAMDTCHGES